MENSPSSPSANPTEGSTSRPSLDPFDPLTPGSHYEREFRAQEGGAALDVFAVLGLPANNAGPTQYGARKHYLKRVARHVIFPAPLADEKPVSCVQVLRRYTEG